MRFGVKVWGCRGCNNAPGGPWVVVGGVTGTAIWTATLG